MMPTMEDIRSLGDFAPTFKWELSFLAGPAVNADLIGLNFRCVSSTLPGKTFTNVPVGLHGHDKNTCGRAAYTPIDLAFIETIDGYVSDFLQGLHIAQWEDNTGIQMPQALIEFDCRLTRMNRQNQPIRAYQLIGAWMSAYTPMGATALSPDESAYVRPTMQITYDYFLEGAPGII